MIKSITPLRTKNEFCEHCKCKCEGIRIPYLLESSNDPNLKKIVCNCCIDIVLNEQGILPEEF